MCAEKEVAWPIHGTYIAARRTISREIRFLIAVGDLKGGSFLQNMAYLSNIHMKF